MASTSTAIPSGCRLEPSLKRCCCGMLFGATRLGLLVPHDQKATTISNLRVPTNMQTTRLTFVARARKARSLSHRANLEALPLVLNGSAAVPTARVRRPRFFGAHGGSTRDKGSIWNTKRVHLEHRKESIWNTEKSPFGTQKRINLEHRKESI